MHRQFGVDEDLGSRQVSEVIHDLTGAVRFVGGVNPAAHCQGRHFLGALSHGVKVAPPHAHVYRIGEKDLDAPESRSLWESVFLGGDRGRGFEADLQAIGAANPSEELAEFLRQAREVDFSVTETRNRLIRIDDYRIEMLRFMADYDVIIGPVMPTVTKPHHHGLAEISDFSHTMVHNLTGWPAAVVRCGTSGDGLPIGVQVAARPWQDVTALAVAGHLENVFGGWRPAPSFSKQPHG